MINELENVKKDFTRKMLICIMMNGTLLHILKGLLGLLLKSTINWVA
jgi:hypothetical protein